MAKSSNRNGGPSSDPSWAQALRDVLIASMSKGQFPLAICGLIVIVMILKMPGEDVSKLMFDIVAKLEQGYLFGYFLFIAAVAGWFFHARRQRRIFDAETRRRRALAPPKGTLGSKDTI